MGEWLVEQFPVWGIPFQNWMVLVAEAREVTAKTSNAKDAIFLMSLPFTD